MGNIVDDMVLGHLRRVEREAEATVKGVCIEANDAGETGTDRCPACPCADRCSIRALSAAIWPEVADDTDA
jgi:hypothetical protein